MRLSRASLLPIVLLAALSPTATARAAGGTAPPAARFAGGLSLMDANGNSTNAAEPSIHIDSKDNVYVSGPNGVGTGGCPFWYVHPDTKSSSGSLYDYRGLIDVDHNGAGGGDCDISSTRADGPFDTVSVTSLTLANLTSNTTSDGGATFQDLANPASQQAFIVDRQWQAADDALGRTYLTVHDDNANIAVSVSTDGGYQFVQNSLAIDPSTNAAAIAYGPVTVNAFARGNHFGALVVNPANHHLYIPFLAPVGNTGTGAQNTFYLAEGDPCAAACQPGVPVGPITWKTHQVFADPSSDNLANDFPTIALDRNGTVYAGFTGAVTRAASSGSGYSANHIFVTHSTDASLDSWTTPQAVDGGGGNSNVFPWLVAGTKGNVGIAYYASTLTPDSGAATTCPGGVGTKGNGTSVSDNCLNNWHVAYAQSTKGDTATPSWTVSDASGLVHQGAICNRGLSCADGTRTLADFFDTAMDSQGRLHIAYAADTRAQGTADILYTRQCTGTSLTGTDLGSDCTPLGVPPACRASAAWTDDAGDATGTPVRKTPTPNDTSADLVGGHVETTADSVVFSVKLNDLVDAPETEVVTVDFAVAQASYYVQASRASGTGAVTYDYGHVTSGTTGGPVSDGAAVGTWDATTDTITIAFPREKAPLSNGAVITFTDVTTARDAVLVQPYVDRATPPCSYTVGAADPVVDVPDVPYAVLAPVAGLLVLGTVYYRRRRLAS